MKAGIYDRKTVPDLLISAAQDFPDKGIGFVQSDGSIKSMTYRELFSRASSLTAGIRSLGMGTGDKVMIIATKNEEIVTMIWTCFLSGLIPTILQPPVSFTEFNQPSQKIENVFRILKDPKVILSDDLKSVFQSNVIPATNIILIDKLRNLEAEPVLFNPQETDIAFIQFSSGSTGDPKGIVLTHQNILTNLNAINIGLDVIQGDTTVNWMPLYHDMGLIGYHLAPIFRKINQFLIEPVDFIKRPALWLDVMDRVDCTITGCPNFGQALLLRYLRNREPGSWDLSSIKAITNGAEPISVKVMDEFFEALSPYGFRRPAMMPVYGMAEATLAITFSELLTLPVITAFNRTMLQKEGRAIKETNDTPEMMNLVSVGKPLTDIEIRVVDEKGNVVNENIDGHIQVRGASVTNKYYDNPVETARSFDNGWLITGDKGFFFDGNFYITGRVKDIIFVRGQNLYAHDLESLAGKFSDISYGKVIIGGLFDPQKGQDQILLFLVGSPNQATCDTFIDLRNFFRDTYGITIDIFIPIRSNQVPKTSSGKIQRYKLISSYQNGEFDGVIAEVAKLMREK